MLHSAFVSTRATAACGSVPAGKAAGTFEAEAAKARAFGAEHVALIFEACARSLWLAPRLHAVIEGWPCDQASSALAFRLCSGLHALARQGRASALGLLHARHWMAANAAAAQFDVAVAEALTEHEDELLQWLSHPTQTNEVARVAGLMGVLAELDAGTPLDTELFELGASAGLNLNLSRYAFQLGDTRLGPLSTLTLAPAWRGRAVPQAPVSVVAARGVDLAPLDVMRGEDRERLFAYIWPGMPERTQRLGAAMELAQKCPTAVETGSAGPWLAQCLATPQRDGLRRVVFHSMVAQYMPEAERAAVVRTLAIAGSEATPDRPLVRVALEWREDRRVVELRCTIWDGSDPEGRQALVATCHPYAEWFDWQGMGSGRALESCLAVRTWR